MEKLKKRDYSIDMLKFFAVFLIINSHMDICYPKFSILATGGAIGDCLFLFASGYTLFWKQPTRFDNWYKRRINRIYPSVIMCALVGALVTWSSNIPVLKFGGGEFVLFIMLYYVLLFFIQKYLIDKLPLVLGLVASISLIVYILWFPYKFETSSKGLYGVTTLYRWIPYFGFMLMGAFVGLKTKISTVKKKCRWYDLMLFVVSLGTFYGIQFVAKKHIEVAPFQIITLFPLAGVIYYFYKLCNASWFENIYSNKYGNVIIMAVSGLCLESYLIQYYLFTDKLNSLFPLNIPLIMLYVLIVSYICRCLARFFSQTFRTEEYEWKKIFEII